MSLALRRAEAADRAALEALQHAAYARNRPLLGVEPLPLLADYADVIARYEIWLAEDAGALQAALILEPRADDLLIWSIATAPQTQGAGIGSRLLALADRRAAELGFGTVRLYTGEPLTGNIAWYGRHGFAIERTETMPDRRIVHMVKTLNG